MSYEWTATEDEIDVAWTAYMAKLDEAARDLFPGERFDFKHWDHFPAFRAGFHAGRGKEPDDD